MKNVFDADPYSLLFGMSIPGSEYQMEARRVKKLIQMTLTILAAMMVSTGHAGETPKCAVSKVPIQITEVAKSAPWPNKSYDSEPFFHRFVTEITEHLSAWQVKEQLCLDNADSKKPSLLKFEKWPDFTAGNEQLVQLRSFDERPTGGCRITSPWIDIAVERKPTVWIRAVVRWNPRQMYVDQAILRGKPKVHSGQAFVPYGTADLPPGVAIPLPYGEFSRFAEDYGVPGGDLAYLRSLPGNLAEQRKLFKEVVARRKLVIARLPPDLLVLFQGATTDSPYSFADVVRHRMHARMSYHTDDYAKLVIALMDRCVASEGAEMNYPSIRDAGDLISLEKYEMYLGHHD